MSSSDIQISLSAFVCDDPTLYNKEGKKAFVKFRLGHSYSRFDEDSKKWENLSNEWFTAKAFGKMAENIKSSIKKGDSVTIQGKFMMENYTNKETGKTTNDQIIVISSIGHNLRFGTSEFESTKLAKAAGVGDENNKENESSLLKHMDNKDCEPIEDQAALAVANELVN